MKSKAAREAESEERKAKEAMYDPMKSMTSHRRGARFMLAYREFGATFLLDRAISYHRSAVEANLPADEDYINGLSDLIKALESRHRLDRNLEDLEEAITLSIILLRPLEEIWEKRRVEELWDQKILDSSDREYREQHPELKHSINEMSFTSRSRNQLTTPDLARQKDLREFATQLKDTACLLYQRYQREDYLGDLRSAATLSEYASRLVREEKANLDSELSFRILTCHARNLKEQYARTGQGTLLPQLESLINRSRGLNKKWSSDFDHLLVVSEIYYERFMRMRSRRYLTYSIDMGIQASEACTNSGENWKKANILSHLGSLLLRRSYLTGSHADIGQGIRYIQLALETTAETSFSRPIYLWMLGKAFKSRHTMFQSPDDLTKSLQALIEAELCSNATPYTRFLVGYATIEHLARIGCWSEATELIDLMQEELPKVFPVFLQSEDCQNRLRKVSGLASLSATISIRAKRSPVSVLGTLEAFGGVVTNRILAARYQDDNLRKHHSRLSRDLEVARSTIGALSFPPGFPDNRALDFLSIELRSSKDLRAKGKALERAVANIRQQPSFERFLLPLSPAEMCALTKEGPIVCLNVSSMGAEAILIVGNKISVILLAGYRRPNAEKLVSMLVFKSNRGRRDASLCVDEEDSDEVKNDHKTQHNGSDLHQALSDLWVRVVRHILRALGFLQQVPKPVPLPRLRWIVSGIASLLPLHAAGTHTPESTENTISHVVSSYSSSLAALHALCRKPPLVIRHKEAKVVVVSMPTSPRHAPLAVAQEVDAILKNTVSWASTSVHERPTKTRVLYALQACTIVHFACHGIVDSNNPSRSGLIVGREAEEILTVEDFEGKNFEHTRIAFLSACSTAEISLKLMADEIINVANGFQLAGFQHVIGTLWGADDYAAAHIASSFYSSLESHEESGNAAVAYALHEAILAYRATPGISMDIRKWAPFIHLGC